MEDTIDQAILAHLIDIGRNENFAQLELLWAAGQLPHRGNLMRLRPQSWFEVADQHSDEEIIALIKALTVAENVLPDWQGGSVSPVIWLYRRLRDRRTVPDNLVEWVRAHTDNPYLA